MRLQVGGRGSSAVGFALYDSTSGAWTSQGVVPLGSFPLKTIDGSVAYDSITNRFVAASSDGADLCVSFISQSPTPWTSIIGGPNGDALDKPWLVSGLSGSCGTKFYVVYYFKGLNRYAYRVSRDGGATWAGSQINFADTGQPVNGSFCAQPVSLPSGGLVVAYTYLNEPTIVFRFLRGADVTPQDCSPGSVSFHQVNWALPGGNSPLGAQITLNTNSIQCDIPWPSQDIIHTDPQAIAVDPTNSSRLYIAYHDIETGQTDVNVYVQEIDLIGAYSGNAKPRVKVNNDSVPGSAQFLPKLAVDATGRIAVVFYDDRNYHSQQSYGCDITKRPKFDVYWAESVDHGATFSNVRLFSAADLWCGAGAEPPELDWALEYAPVQYMPGDYIGISTMGNEFIATYSGTVSCDPDSDKSVIFSSRITP